MATKKSIYVSLPSDCHCISIKLF